MNRACHRSVSARLPLAAAGSLCLAALAAAAPVAEESVTYAGVRFRVVRSEPARVGLVWKDENGRAFGSFDKVHAALAARGKTPRFLMNAGLFQPGGAPCGLHIEHGRTLNPVNTRDGRGNFHLKPNGVCWIESGGNARKAVIAETGVYQNRAAVSAADGKTTVETAVQSGPLLLAAGKRHPAFREGSSNKLHRNGVGVDSGGRLVFAMTGRGQAVNFWDFAGLFLSLGCQDALFLDGNISQMSVNPSKPEKSNPFGAMFVICD